MFFLLSFSFIKSVTQGITGGAEDLSTYLTQVDLKPNDQTLHKETVQLPQGVLFASWISINSRTIDIEGCNTSLIHRSDQSNNDVSILPYPTTSIESSFKSAKGSKLQTQFQPHFLLTISNSTISLSKLSIISTTTGESVGQVRNSAVHIQSCLIVSCPMTSPFMVRGTRYENENTCSITISESSHKSQTTFLPPLVDSFHIYLPRSSHRKHGRVSLSDCPSHVSVTGLGLSLESSTISLATGLLFSFDLSDSDSHQTFFEANTEVATHLSSSTLVNVTNRLSPKVRKEKGLLFGSNVKQILSGCRVTNSTNPISGTGTMDANLGGSLFCLNTSFSSCERSSNTPVDISYEPFVDFQRYAPTDLAITAITFTLCSFDTMTWGEEWGDFGGAAIYVRDTNAALTVTQCFFHCCTVTYTGNDGGAISFYCVEGNRHPLTMTNSSFSECASTFEHEHNTAGAVVAVRQSQVSYSNCFCHKCWVKGRGGGFYFIDQDSVTVRNCAFVECESGTYGGGILITLVKSLSFSFLQFRGCVAKGQGTEYGKDITIFESDATVLNTSSVLFCDSTSETPSVLNHDTLTPIPDLITQVSAPTVTGCSVTLNGNEAVVSVTTSTAISGTMGVLLSGLNVPRLVHVEFGSPGKSSTTGKGITTAGLTLQQNQRSFMSEIHNNMFFFIGQCVRLSEKSRIRDTI